MQLNEINHIAHKSNITIASLSDFKHIVSNLQITDANVEDFIGKYCFIEIGSSLARWRAEIQHVPPIHDSDGNQYSGDEFYEMGQWYFKQEHPNVIKLIFDDNQKFNNKLPKKDGFDGKTYATAVKLSKKENIYGKDGFCFYYTDGEDFTEDKAAKLKDFVNANLEENNNVKFIIHCMQGKSRSAAVGMYIAKKIGQFNDEFISEYDNNNECQFNIGISKKGQPKYPHKNLMSRMGELEQWSKTNAQSKDKWFYDTLINHPITGYNAKKQVKMAESNTKKKIIITEQQLQRLINEDVFIASKDDSSKKASLKYAKNQSYNKGNLNPFDKLKTDKMDSNNKDTYEVPLKGGLMSYNITSISGQEVMHYFKRIFNKQATFVKFNKEEYELEMEDAEFKSFMTQFLNKIENVVNYKINEFKQENPELILTDFAIYPVPSSSRFNTEMAKRLQLIPVSGLNPRLINSEILQKDFTKVKRDEDFINKNKDYYDSELGVSIYKNKTHNDNVNTTKNKFNAHEELKKRVDTINSKVKKLLNIWNNRHYTTSPTYYDRLYKYYMDYVNCIDEVEKQNVYYQNALTDTDTKLYFGDSIQVLKYTKGPSVEKRSNEIVQTLRDKGYLNWSRRKKAPDVVFRELKPMQIKSVSNDVRMGLSNYFSINDEKLTDEKDIADSTVLLVFDDNISGGATLSDICSRLMELGFKFIIPITFGKMHTSYNLGTLAINKPEKFNY